MKRFKFISAAHLLLIRNGNILLLRRHNTGYSDGMYSLVAGHIDKNESATQAMVREAFEEVGILVARNDLTLAHFMHHHDKRLFFFFTAMHWSGTPENKEPDKCDHMFWCPIGRLPENTIPYTVHAIACYLNNISYSEFGW